jgi:hypothetical protein
MTFKLEIKIVADAVGEGFHWAILLNGKEIVGVPNAVDIDAVAWQVETQLW